ncbi:MAG: MFS transporter [Alphaproteobacteria bacterium]|nr:MFS transporter [Alphaproteobacteria bacterium]
MTQRAPTPALVAWALYDWANSAQPTLITTFVFAAYFTQKVAGDPVSGTAAWGFAASAAALAVALASPVLGAIADNAGRRKPWLGWMTALAVLSTALLWFIRPAPEYAGFALALVAAGTFFFELGMVFYNAMLPALAPRSMIGRMSGWAWGLGYAGGLAALVVALFAFIKTDDPWFGVGTDDAANVRAVALLAAAWFALFALPLFVLTPDSPPSGMRAGAAVRAGLKALAGTIRNVRAYPGLAPFLLGMMFVANALTTLFAFGGIYAAAAFGFSFEDLLLFGIAMNVTAGLGAAAFGWLDDRIGPKKTILIAVAGLLALGAAILLAETKTAFWAAALPLGIFVGPAQAAGRSFMARMAPAHLRTEMFGLYALAGKATNFLGPAVLAFVTQAAQSQRAGMATILVFFVIGAALLWRAPDPRGMESR